ncbi:MAG: type II toxin-antitoxin system CcdA family antitoxin [Devosia nanyangense]|uniref:Type II toxin-antitoxin system CcdA family antitoxin n=1 Tax=Devosia nanyangense TaxID=1228055 RepID=A0A933L1G6_9HYPH|nr:type II toxin-antitoxin system CcdA family antitoxin [Devosia nanyangense]
MTSIKKHDAELPPEPRGPSPERRNVVSEEGRKWLEENADVIRSSNEYVEKHGLPLAKYQVWSPERE